MFAQVIPAPAPRLSRTPGKNDPSWRVGKNGQNTRTVLTLYGFTSQEIDELGRKSVVKLGEPAKL